MTYRNGSGRTIARFILGGAVLMFMPRLASAAPPVGQTSAAQGFTNVGTFSPAMDTGSRSVGAAKFETNGVRLNGDAPATGGHPQQITLEVPQSLQGRRLVHIELNHRQDLGEKTRPWSGRKGERDETAPYSRVEVYTNGKWTTVGGRDHFAEARPEVDRLHDLADPGGPISAVRVMNVGVDPLHVDSVTLHTLPAKRPSLDETILTPATSFGDPWNGVEPRVSRLREQVVNGTRYPGAITLNKRDAWGGTPQETLDAVKSRGWTLESDSVLIPLQPGKQIRTVEVAIGDTRPNPERNNDGGYGKKGYSKLYMFLEHHDGTRSTITNRENVPSQGILVATPDSVVQPGDRLRIQVTDDTAALMGVRLGYDDTSVR
jgi:hypothetical protein